MSELQHARLSWEFYDAAAQPVGQGTSELTQPQTAIAVPVTVPLNARELRVTVRGSLADSQGNDEELQAEARLSFAADQPTSDSLRQLLSE